MLISKIYTFFRLLFSFKNRKLFDTTVAQAVCDIGQRYHRYIEGCVKQREYRARSWTGYDAMVVAYFVTILVPLCISALGITMTS